MSTCASRRARQPAPGPACPAQDHHRRESECEADGPKTTAARMTKAHGDPWGLARSPTETRSATRGLIFKQLAARVGDGPAIAVGTQRLLEQSWLSTATREANVILECQVQLGFEDGDILTRSCATPCRHLTDHQGPMKRASAEVQSVHYVRESRLKRLRFVPPHESAIGGQIHDGHVQPQKLGG